MRTRSQKRSPVPYVIASLSAIALASSFALAADLGIPNHPPAVIGVPPGGPVFVEGRPKPPADQNAQNPDSLLTPPDDTFRIERRNNFYKKDGSDGLYRWAASGHWSNYDEARTAGWQKSIPDVLKMNNGKTVTTADEWRNIRRPEIVKLFETYVYGKIPATAPKVIWTKNPDVVNANGTITCSATGTFVNADGTPFVPPAGGPGRGPGGNPNIPGVGAQLDQSFEHLWEVAAPAAPPATAPGARAGRGGGRGGFGGGRGGPGGLTISYTIPANAAGPVPLVQGNAGAAAGLGTVNFGGSAPNVRSNPPAPDDWGAIRRYGWVVSRGIDYLETDPRVDAHQIAIQGASIGGKQALVAGAFDERVSMVAAFVSGEMGASMSRHDWGETIDDVAQLSSQNYCENFQYFVGHFDQMPTDSHMLISLMAGRHLLVTGGTTDQWSDPVGVFWGVYYSSPVWKLLGQKGIDEKAPPEPGTFIGEELAYYDHIGGHAVLPPENQKNAEMIQKFLKIKPAAK